MNLGCGVLVRSRTNNLGIGKILTQSDSQVEVEYFCSVGDRIRKILPVKNLQWVELERQTRCYILSESLDRWRMGRIFAREDDRPIYQVDLPDGQTQLFPEAEIYVRCNRPIADPIDILAMKGNDTPYFHDRRLPFVESLIEQRAVSRGMTGLFSANIALYPHQVEVIRRVLEDPIQRYLLADEVGLGKTIEAGAILRQYLLDEPQGRGLVLVPEHLVEQWRQELQEKFYLSDFGDRIQILAVNCWSQIKLHRDLDFLILDEAHHIASFATASDRAQQQCFEVCKKLAHRAKRLLLLSATPVLNNEQDFLAMLHFLDPATYRLEDLAGFRERVKKRQEIGRILLSFQEGTKPFVLKINLKKLKDLFAEDRYLIDQAEALEADLQGETGSPENRDRLVRSIRNHISDTYRLHRRMLRNRRESIEDVIFDRHPTLTPEYDLDERTPRIHELLDEWRMIAPSEPAYQRLFLLLFRASSTWLGIFQQVVESRLTGVAVPALNSDFSAEDLHRLTQTPHFAGEPEILEALLKLVREPSEEGDRLQLLILILLQELSTRLKVPPYGNWQEQAKRVKQLIASPLIELSRGKIVVFTSYTQVCHQIIRVLREAFGEQAVAAHYFGQSSQESEANIQKFCKNSQCLILVCDRSGEEGRNLQMANWAIHFDLPGSPNQLEQRIGRIDRIGSQRDIKFSVLTGPELDDSFQEVWYQILKDGFEIFQSSIASLQFYVDEKIPKLERLIFELEPSSLFDQISEIQKEIESEKTKVREQNTLDEIDALNENAVQYFQQLDEYDAEHPRIMRATESWFRETLQFQQINEQNLQGLRTYKPTRKTLIPVSEIVERFQHCLKNPGTYNRRLANQHQKHHVRLYRTGERLIDALNEYIHWDDRGQAFAMWRYDSAWDESEGMEWLGFRFNYEIETDLEAAKISLENQPGNAAHFQSLKRLADALFPPRLETVFLDAQFETMSGVEDPKVLEILQRPYRDRQKNGSRDYNLAKKRLPVLEQFIDSSQWPKVCHQARQQSEAFLREQPDFIAECDRLFKAAQGKLDNRVNQIRLRLNRLSESEPDLYRTLSQELATESALSQALLSGIYNPRIRLDSVGFFIIAGYPLSVELKEEDEP
ncbi:SNF2-related protein [Laspinema sp. D1]|uniref:protein DpdE n=1 Tax=Laspinema palackyanum TaxID=3231601 RepID=UPI00347236CD|nr:SNF2-related protein [Laspinema sp. D2b]